MLWGIYQGPRCSYHAPRHLPAANALTSCVCLVMNTPDALTVNGNWRRASSSADTDLKAQTITGTHATFALPITPQPVRAAPAPTRRHHGTTDNFFGVTHLHTMRGSRHDSYRFLCHEIPPPPYPDAGLPAYSAEPNTEPITLAMYLFKFGFCMCNSRLLRRRCSVGCPTLTVVLQCSRRFGFLGPSS